VTLAVNQILYKLLKNAELSLILEKMRIGVTHMKKIITAPDAPAAIGPYSHAVQVDNLLYASGQIPLDPVSMKIVEGGIEAETRQVMKNIEAVLKAAGLDFSHVIKATIFLANIADLAAMNSVYAEAFPENPPARSCYQVAALPAGAKVEIEVIARFD